MSEIQRSNHWNPIQHPASAAASQAPQQTPQTEAPQTAPPAPRLSEDQNQTQSVSSTPIDPNSAGQTIRQNQFTSQLQALLNQADNDAPGYDVQDALQSYIENYTGTDFEGGAVSAENFAETFGGDNKEAYHQLVSDGLNHIRGLPADQQQEALNRFVNLMLNNIGNVLENKDVVDESGSALIAGGPGC